MYFSKKSAKHVQKLPSFGIFLDGTGHLGNSTLPKETTQHPWLYANQHSNASTVNLLIKKDI